MPLSPKLRTWIPVFLIWLVLDQVTKRIALDNLWPPGVPHEVLGEYLRFTLAFNRGAAMGMHLGEWSRPFFTVVALILLGVLGYVLVKKTAPGNRRQAAILGFIMAGAVGNLIDRLRDVRGVTDFIDIGVGTVRFWTFNVADMGITLGAIALALTMQTDETPHRGAEATG